VRLSDGTVGFVRNAFDAEMERIFAEVLDELFGLHLVGSEAAAQTSLSINP
jgi:hypothetical protein